MDCYLVPVQAVKEQLKLANMQLGAHSSRHRVVEAEVHHHGLCGKEGVLIAQPRALSGPLATARQRISNPAVDQGQDILAKCVRGMSIGLMAGEFGSPIREQANKRLREEGQYKGDNETYGERRHGLGQICSKVTTFLI